MLRTVRGAINRLVGKKSGIRILKLHKPYKAIVPKGFDVRRDKHWPVPYRGENAPHAAPVFGYQEVTIVWETAKDDQRYPNHVVTKERQLIPRELVYQLKS